MLFEFIVDFIKKSEFDKNDLRKIAPHFNFKGRP